MQNPSDHDVDVELQVRLDDATVNGDVDPFTFTVPAGRATVTNISADGRVPAGLGYTAVATATDGTPIVADRVVTETEPLAAVTVTMGSPALGTDWIVPVASGSTVTSTAIIVTNPSATDPVTVTVSSVADGAETPIPEADQHEIAAGDRMGVAVPVPADKPLTSVHIVSSAPVVAEARLVFKDAGLAAPLAVPVQGIGPGGRPGPPGRPRLVGHARPERHGRPERSDRRDRPEPHRRVARPERARYVGLLGLVGLELHQLHVGRRLTMERALVAVVLVAVAVVIALVLQRRRPDAPTQPTWTVPAQVDRDDFASPGRPMAGGGVQLGDL